ncbi:MAG: hypothetical protein AAFX53_11830 [Bacteroidota bacterium]
MENNRPLLFLLLAFIGSFGIAQEIKVFTTKDFDLLGPVKTCMVITDYGKEEYEFDREGLLTKSITRHSDTDYDITYYKYRNKELLEKRLENYRNDTFDPQTSIAHFYEYDTLSNTRITEKIISYNKEFLDQYEYLYDSSGRISKIIRTNNDGTDETHIEYSTFKNEQTKSYYTQNGILQKSTRTSTRKGKRGFLEKVVLTKKFVEEQPHTATEEILNKEDKLISVTRFIPDPKKKGRFAPREISFYEYEDMGALSKIVTQQGNSEEVQEYIYQYDGTESANWVRQIISPENTYTSRRISYYETVPEKPEDTKQ